MQTAARIYYNHLSPLEKIRKLFNRLHPYFLTTQIWQLQVQNKRYNTDCVMISYIPLKLQL